MRYQIYDAATQQLLDADAIPTPYMLAEWKQRRGPAVRRGKLWYAIDFPGFSVQAGEAVHNIRIREVP